MAVCEVETAYAMPGSPGRHEATLVRVDQVMQKGMKTWGKDFHLGVEGDGAVIRTGEGRQLRLRKNHDSGHVGLWGKGSCVHQMVEQIH